MKRIILISTLISALLFACDDDDGGSNTQADVDAALTAFATQICTLMVDCCTDTYSTVDECVSAQDMTMESSDKYTVDYDQVIECLKARSASLPDSCDEEYIDFYNLKTDECVGLSIGLTLEGEACSNQTECEPGTFCFYDWDSDGYTVCAAQGALNEPCQDQDWGDPCVWGLVCLDNSCVDPIDIGQPCDYAYQCGADYLAGVWCIDHVCDYLRESGEECTYDDDCLSENCDGNICIAKTFVDTCYDY